MKRRTLMAGLAGAAASWTLPARADDAFGSKELIEAAEKEGSITYYTANFAEVEQEVIKAFNKRFPKIKVADICTCFHAAKIQAAMQRLPNIFCQ